MAEPCQGHSQIKVALRKEMLQADGMERLLGSLLIASLAGCLHVHFRHRPRHPDKTNSCEATHGQRG